MGVILSIILKLFCYNLKVTKQICPETIIFQRLIPTTLTINNTSVPILRRINYPPKSTKNVSTNV